MAWITSSPPPSRSTATTSRRFPAWSGQVEHLALVILCDDESLCDRVFDVVVAHSVLTGRAVVSMITSIVIRNPEA